MRYCDYMIQERERVERSLKSYLKLCSSNLQPQALEAFEKTILGCIRIDTYPIWRDVFKDTKLEEQIMFNSDIRHLTEENVLSYLNFYVKEDADFRLKALAIIQDIEIECDEDFISRFVKSEFGEKFSDWLMDNSLIWLRDDGFYIGNDDIYGSRAWVLVETELNRFQHSSGLSLDKYKLKYLRQFVVD